METIAERLSLMEDLYFPRSLLPSAVNPPQRKSLLLDLLRRDVPVFLERYGSKLTIEELREFDVLKEDYEINWHLKRLRSIMSPTSDELRSRCVTVKNRRRAYLNKLIFDGDYFSEDAMRDREPYLHHEYVGKFQDLSGRTMARPGERWSETLLRRSEEAILIAKIRGEQQRLGVAERDWLGGGGVETIQEEEEEEEEDDDDDDDDDDEEDEDEAKEESNGVAESRKILQDHPNAAGDDARSNTAGSTEQTCISAAELQDQMEQFTFIMHEKFLLGEDHEHIDYSKIDNDETLDDHWLKQANDDAEEKYFDED